MLFSDRLTLDKPRRTADGFMAIHARAARTGVYQYLGREIDPDGAHFAADQIVNVYRPPDEVFDKASLGSFIGKPITDDHPSEAVTADNWRDLSRGTIMTATRDVANDGEFVGFDLAFMDADLISKIDSGKRELSNGYAARLDVEDGVAPDGTPYQAVQRDIRGNHVAVVDAGRAGSSCCIGDAQLCTAIPSDEVRKLLVDQRTYDAACDNAKNDAARNQTAIGDATVPKLIIIDGHQIDISNVDVAEATIKTLQDKLTAAIALADKASADVATLTTEKATLDAKAATLEKQLDDAKAATPAMLRDAAKRFADTLAKAEALGVKIGDDANEAEIMAAVVNDKLGDLAKDWTPDQIAASFAALTVDAATATKPDLVRDGISKGISPVAGAPAVQISDARRSFLARKETAYLGGNA